MKYVHEAEQVAAVDAEGQIEVVQMEAEEREYGEEGQMEAEVQEYEEEGQMEAEVQEYEEERV